MLASLDWTALVYPQIPMWVFLTMAESRSASGISKVQHLYTPVDTQHAAAAVIKLYCSISIALESRSNYSSRPICGRGGEGGAGLDRR